ncbi:MAG: NADH-quinone oxidoreductase subunit C [Propionibacteriaceae bacterium]|jgi:NADH-quinone oxidoreductase subunit C|nr:NADH-quinone oxidoreductase subunit C [Propionibacteriaceae bacterium]
MTQAANASELATIGAEVDASATPVPVAVRKGMWGSGPGDVSGFGGISRPVVRHRRASRPYGSWFDVVVDRLIALVPQLPDEVSTDHDELTVYVPKQLLLEVVRVVRDDAQLRFETCPSVSGIHYPDEPGAELHVVYNLISMTHNRRLRLEVVTAEDDPLIDSVTEVYPHANWHERETWDMFGVIFVGHPGLTRILMPDDWDGHPQLKDYPLGGVPVEFKGAQVPPADERRSY